MFFWYVLLKLEYFVVYLKDNSNSPEKLPVLSFEISPRNNQLKSFTLPASGRSGQSSKRDSYNSSFYKEARNEMTRKSPSLYSTSSLSDQSQEKIEIVCIYNIADSCQIIVIFKYDMN